ncbi:hypothetical protein V3C99_009710, partial [Haemonchus contortus]
SMTLLVYFMWALCIFIVSTFLSVPLYISIIIITINDWKHVSGQKTINLLIISQGIADLFLNLNFIVFIILRHMPTTRQFFWDFQHYYIGTWCIDLYYVSTIMRTIGILLITVQRYLTMCANGSCIEQWTNSGYRWILVIIHWIFPFAYVLPIVGRDLQHFNDPIAMDVAAPSVLVTEANIIAFWFVLPAFVVCLFCYSSILRYLFRHRLDRSVARQRERRVCVQMIGVVVALTLCTVYHVLQFDFSLKADEYPIFWMRRVAFPLLTCFMSYVNPWMMFLTSREIRQKVFAHYGLNHRCLKSNMFVVNEHEPTIVTFAAPRIKPISDQPLKLEGSL